MAEGGRRRKKGRTQTAFRLDAEAVQLEADAAELGDWFHSVVDIGEFENRDTFLNSLNTGTVLCDLMFKLFPDRRSKIFDEAEPGTFQARDNISKFLEACKALGLAESSLFTADDLVERANDKAVFQTLQLVKEKAPGGDDAGDEAAAAVEEKAEEAAAASVEDAGDAGDAGDAEQPAAVGGDEDVPPTHEDAEAAEEQAAEATAEETQEPAAADKEEEPAPEPYDEAEPKCSFCSKELLGKKFKCGGCQKKIWYCDRQCQRKDWREHKKVCERRHKQ